MPLPVLYNKSKNLHMMTNLYNFGYRIVTIIYYNLASAFESHIKFRSIVVTLQNNPIFKTNPIATYIALGSPTSGEEYDIAANLVSEIIGAINENYTETAIIQFIQAQYDFTISHTEIVYAVGVGLSEQLLDFDTLPPEFYTLPAEIPSSGSSDSSDSSTPRDENSSILNSIGNFMSDHKVAIIVTGVVVVAGVIIAYVIYKRRTPPGESPSMIELPTQSATSRSTSSSVSKIVFIIKNVTLLSIVLSVLPYFYGFYTIGWGYI